MRTDSGLTPGLSDTVAGGDGELALDREGRSGVVEHAPRATSSTAKVRGQTRRAARCPDTPRTLSAGPGLGPDLARCLADKVLEAGRGRQ
jgi:hypothetical protein